MRLALLLSFGLLASCGNSSVRAPNGKRYKAKETSYTYEYKEDGCSTGLHTYDSKDSYCQGLLDDETNQSCAAAERSQAYQNECSGTTEP